MAVDKNKVVLVRGCTLRTVRGGYGRVVEDGLITYPTYLPRGTVLTVLSFDLYSKTVIVKDDVVHKSVALEYSFVLDDCVVTKVDKQTFINALVLVDPTDNRPKEDYIKNLDLLLKCTIVELVALALIAILHIF